MTLEIFCILYFVPMVVMWTMIGCHLGINRIDLKENKEDQEGVYSMIGASMVPLINIPLCIFLVGSEVVDMYNRKIQKQLKK